MDWKYKHFKEQAVFSAPISSVLDAARLVVGESFGQVEDTADGLVARGRSGWHNAVATFRVASVATGTQLSVELLVERSTMRGYMLFDVGGYYNAQIDKWFTGVSQRLASSGDQALVRKSTMSYRVRQGCLAGCLVWLIAVLCLGVAGTALDRAMFPQSSQSIGGPFSLAASTLALLIGVGAFAYVGYPAGPIARFFRERFNRA